MDCGVAKGERAFSAEKIKEQESEGKKQGVRRAMDTLVLFEKIILKCG